MKYDLTKFPVGEDDVQLKDEAGKPSTYKHALIKAVAAGIKTDGQPITDGELKMKHYALYLKLKKANGSVNLDSEEVKVLSDAVMLYPIIIAGQCRDFLNQKED